jgi:ATP-binding cassette subfamily F protein 3
MAERSAERKPHSREITECENKIEKLEDQMALKNEALTEASNKGDNDAIMEISKEVGVMQQEIDALFERLEIATELDEEIVARYEVKLEEIDV